MLGNPLTIIDSMKIMNSYLGSLCKNISEDDFKYLCQKKFFEYFLELVKQKGVYLYECMDSFEMFTERLPEKGNFYSSLSNKHVSNKDCKQISKILKAFGKI